MLFGRVAELQRLEELVQRARAGISGVVVVHGEPGSGKTSLLEQFVSSLPQDVTVLRTLGVESEAHLAYAGLTGLFRPILDLVPQLPAMQRSALASALALEGVERGGDQLAVAAGGLALLAAAATASPTVVVIDDVQWLEPSSRFAVLFAARRIANDRLCIVLAARGGPGVDPMLRGFPRLALGGLNLDEATQLVATQRTDMGPNAVEALVDATGGNPLALIEAARGLDEWQITGVHPLGSPLSVGDHLESAFAVHLDRLSPQGRIAVALAAAEPSGERLLLLSAADDLGVDLSGFREAVDAHLLEESASTITVRHPLLRSVALRRADREDRTRMHRALANHLDGEEHAERRAWHLAAASDGPDENVAALLESAASAALARSDLATAVAGFQQAAMLSPRRTDRGRRLFGAGAAASQFGQGDELLRQAQGCTDDPARRAEIIVLRARGAIEKGDHILVAQLVRDEIDAVLKESQMTGALLLAIGAAAAWSSARFDQLTELSERAYALIEEQDRVSGAAILPLSVALLASVVSGRPDVELGRTCAAVRSGIHPSLASPVLFALTIADELVAAETLRISSRKQCRDEGSLMALTWVDGVAIILALRRGQLSQAYAMGTAVLELVSTIASPFGQAEVHINLAHIEAITGLESSCRGRVELVRGTTARSGTDVIVLQAEYVLGLLELGQGRLLAAVRQLEHAHHEFELRGLLGLGLWPVLADLIEATALSGEVDEARRLLALLQTRAGRDPLPFTAVATSRIVAFMAGDDEVIERFATAIARARGYGNPFEEGRTHLAYGRRLAALGRGEAVETLQLSHECFRLVGATPWADRAADELEAIGRSRPPQTPTLTQLLTPHEQEVVALAITGATTREIATDLLVSPKTVESHLTSSYRKLGVRSKTQLAHVLNRPANGRE
jgi:DNA-binding CsgD family transcriptional regulator